MRLVAWTALLAPPLAVILAATPASAATDRTPMVFHKATSTAEVELRAPKALSAWPALREALVSSDTAKLNGFVRTSAVSKGRRNWRRVRYEMAGETGRLVSLIRRDDRDTGGAHPLSTETGVIWDQRTKQRLPVSSLLRPDADPGPLDRALCKAVKAAKAEREGAASLDGQTWRCPSLSQTQAALAPSTAQDKAGGLVVLVNPYEVGPYAEGGYRILLPASDFRKALRRGYAAEFAGEPSDAADALAAQAPAPTPLTPSKQARKRSAAHKG